MAATYDPSGADGTAQEGHVVAKFKGEDGKTVYRIEAEAKPSEAPAANVSSKAA